MIEKIIATYEKNLFSLPAVYQAHFCLRMYRITGAQKYKEALITKRRLSNSVYDLFLAKSLGLPTAGLARLKKRNWRKYLLAGKLPYTDPSACANTVYYLKYLGICDLEDELISLYKKIWLSTKKIYALTHIIIAASYYYQRYLNPKKFAWILDYFEKNIDEIIAKTNPDIVAEVGLCFRLCRQGNNKTVTKAKRFLEHSFDAKKGYIPRKKNDSLARAEHRNILAVLFLAKYDKFYPGPKLTLTQP